MIACSAFGFHACDMIFQLEKSGMVRACLPPMGFPLVGQGRIELPTYGLGNRRSVQLSYYPVKSGNMIPYPFPIGNAEKMTLENNGEK